MSSPKGRRAWPIDKILYRYFQLRDAGPPSTTIKLGESAPSNRKRGGAPRVPMWIIRMCDVGIALEKIPPLQRDAVALRWEMVIGQEDAERDLTVLSIRRARALREGRECQEIDREMSQTSARYDEQWKTRRRVERRKAYRDGMDALEIILEKVS